MANNQFVNEYLTADHRRLDLLFHGLMQAIKEDKTLEYQQSLFHLFKTGLLRHMHWEETILFPIFEESTGMTLGPTMVMCSEHEEMRTILVYIESELDKGFNADLLAELANCLHGHNQKEEQILYPAIDKISSGNQQKIALEISKDFK